LQVASLTGRLVGAKPEAIIEPRTPHRHNVGPTVRPMRRQPIIVRSSQSLLSKGPGKHPIWICRHTVAWHVRAARPGLRHVRTIAGRLRSSRNLVFMMTLDLGQRVPQQRA
jgi:hypothetical protein